LGAWRHRHSPLFRALGLIFWGANSPVRCTKQLRRSPVPGEAGSFFLVGTTTRRSWPRAKTHSFPPDKWPGTLFFLVGEVQLFGGGTASSRFPVFLFPPGRDSLRRGLDHSSSCSSCFSLTFCGSSPRLSFLPSPLRQVFQWFFLPFPQPGDFFPFRLTFL